ncbi:MAG: DUF3105 domain-containing protein [Aldersonia sp.]|nr:DUF3105 domain-containing protein [Aldersonia sp.]
MTMTEPGPSTHYTDATMPPITQPATARAATKRNGRGIFRKLAIAGVAVLGVVVLLFAALLGVGAVTGDHTLGSVTYAQIPPHSGAHSPVVQRCGFYAEPVGNEHAVHALEHGVIWITYRPDLGGNQVEVLRTVARTQPDTLVSPFRDLPAPVVVSAWGQQTRFDTAHDPRLAPAIQDFRNNSLAAEPGGGCDGPNLWISGATGNPES